MVSGGILLSVKLMAMYFIDVNFVVYKNEK